MVSYTNVYIYVEEAKFISILIYCNTNWYITFGKYNYE